MCFGSDSAPAQAAPPPPKPLYVNPQGSNPDGSSTGDAGLGAARKKLRIELAPQTDSGTGISAPGI